MVLIVFIVVALFGFSYGQNELRPKHVQLKEFSRLAHGLRSAPILVLDKRTFYVPNLHYDGKGPDAHFWVGKGSSGPEPNGIKVANEHGSFDNLNAYTGQSINVTLPEGTTVDDIDYFGIWCIQYKHNFGYVDIPKNLDVPFSLPIDPNKTVVRLPKCCSTSQTYQTGGCHDLGHLPDLNLVIEFEIHKNNDTHLDETPLGKDEYEIDFFQYLAPCDLRYALKPEEFLILSNGSLLSKTERKLKKLDDFCIELYTESDDNSESYLPLLCFVSTDPALSSFSKFYQVGLGLSFVLLILTALTYGAIPELREPIGMNKIGYSLSLGCCTLVLIIGSSLDTRSAGIGYAYHILLAFSIIWYSLINFELYYMIKYFNREYPTSKTKRRIIYFIVAIVAAVVQIIILFGGKITADIPNFVSPAPELRLDEGTLSLYIIYFLILFGNGIGLVFIRMRMTNTDQKDVAWIMQLNKFNGIFRSGIMLGIVILISTVAEIISLKVEPFNGVLIALNVIHSLQGLVVFLLFILRQPITSKIKKFFRSFSNVDQTSGTASYEKGVDNETTKLNMTQ